MQEAATKHSFIVLERDSKHMYNHA